VNEGYQPIDSKIGKPPQDGSGVPPKEFNPCYICPKCDRQEFWIKDYGHFGCVAIDLNGNPIKEEPPKYYFSFEGRCFFCGHIELYGKNFPEIENNKPKLKEEK